MPSIVEGEGAQASEGQVPLFYLCIISDEQLPSVSKGSLEIQISRAPSMGKTKLQPFRSLSKKTESY
jgi:hypothetical protein